jgi:hypothetical protein
MVISIFAGVSIVWYFRKGFVSSIQLIPKKVACPSKTLNDEL